MLHFGLTLPNMLAASCFINFNYIAYYNTFLSICQGFFEKKDKKNTRYQKKDRGHC